jgi:hypothetical protein
MQAWDCTIASVMLCTIVEYFFFIDISETGENYQRAKLHPEIRETAQKRRTWHEALTSF